MNIVIVPDSLRHAINSALDTALADAPPDALLHREDLYQQLLAYYNEHGALPDFSIVRNEPKREQQP